MDYLRREFLSRFSGRIFIFWLFFVLSFNQALAASIYFSPSSAQKTVGNTFTVTVRVNTNGVAINAGEGSIVFDPDKLQVVSVSKSGSIFSLWASEPSFSNAEGNIDFSGGVTSPGFSGSNGLILNITFKAKSATTVRGVTDVILVSGAILANDGEGTNVLTSLGKANFFISPSGTVEPSDQIPTTIIPPTLTKPNLLAPVILSSTHPDQEKWYSNKNPLFRWDLPSEVKEIWLVLSKRANSSPIIKYSPPISEKELTDLEDGSWYLNARFRTAEGLGAITSFRFNIDSQPPQQFDITRLDQDDLTNPRPALLFESLDAASGLEKYQIKIGSGAWVDIDPALAGNAYAIPLQKYGDYEVEVKALDRAGNSSSAKINITIESIKAPVIKEITKEAGEGKPVIIKGMAEPGRKILIEFAENGSDLINSIPQVYARQIDTNHFIYEVFADVNGYWSIKVADLPPGRYKVAARIQDERQAVSEASNIVNTEIKKEIWDGIWKFVSKMFDFLVNLLSKGWLLIALGAFLVFLVMIIVNKLVPLATNEIRKIKHIASEYHNLNKLKRLNSRAKLELKILEKDLKKELELLSKIAHHRTLHPDEQYLKNKLERYYNILKKLRV